MADLNRIAEKWQKKWNDSGIFEANPDKRKKFFINFPYPYINSYLHLGHAFSVTRVDVFARYKRMQGFNVLFPQGWHCTGTPVWAAAQRVKEKEPKQLKILESLGFSQDEIGKFSDVKHWIDVFVPAAKEDLMKLGASVDWRRSFITTDLNPRYDKFIRWQFRKLKEKGYVTKGEHPVVWCPKDNMPVGDHDRVEGEGEVPQEYSLLKFKLDDGYLIAATLRPETVFGETNFWIKPDAQYAEAQVGNEKWILSERSAEKLANQGKDAKILRKINGKDLIGKYCKAPLTNKDIMILPADFIDMKMGTGLVVSVPSDAPFDYVALRDLQNNESSMQKYGLNPDVVRKIKPIPIIVSKDYGDMAAVKIVEDMKIKSQHDKNLEEATNIIYKAGFYSGKMNSSCGRYAGMPVEEAKKEIKKELAEKKLIESFYEMTGKAVCRCLTECIVKTVSDQWFLRYDDEKWKDSTRKALANLKLYPELARSQFNHVLGWLNHWACTHHHGTGTKLPWDEKWVIESLSDSTIYMAFYTIAHLLKEIPEKYINDELFDYIFLGKGSLKKFQKLRKEFEYWYPFDVRSSGKDLIQNHLSFCLFNHSAIFPEKYWPRAFSVNGWLLVDGEKMSKSRGNFFTIREIIGKYSADVARASLMLGGEGLNDPNFDMNNAKAIGDKLSQWMEFARSNHKPGKQEKPSINDRIFVSAMNRTLKEGTAFMEEMMFRSAFEKLFFQMQRALKEYVRKGDINQNILNEFIEVQTKALSPFCPFTSEETWNIIGKKGFVSTSGWPRYDEKKIDDEAEATSELVDATRKDIIEIIRLAKIEKPKKITLFIAEKWKYDFYKRLKGLLAETRNTGEILKKLMSTDLKKHGQEISKALPRIMNDASRIPAYILDQKAEIDALENASAEYSKEIGCKVIAACAEQSNEPKSRHAMPGKVSIVIE